MGVNDSIIDYGDLIGDDGTFVELTANIKKLEKELLALAKISKKAFGNLKPDDLKGMQELEVAVKKIEVGKRNLVKSEKALQTAKKKTIDLTNQELQQREEQKLVNRERVQQAKQLAILAKAEKNSIEAIRAQLSLETLAWKKLTAEELKNTEKGKKLVKTKLDLTNQLKKLEKATGDHRREVGNYGNSLKRLDRISKGVRKGLLRLFVGRTIIDGIARLGGALFGLVDDFRESDAEIEKVGVSLDKLKNGAIAFGLIFLKFISKPLELFVSLAESASKALFGVGFGAEKASVGVKNLQKEFNEEIEVLKRGNISTEARSKLITDINTKYKDYLPNLIKESDSLDDITKAQDAANVAFEKKITLLASEEQFIDIRKRRNEALTEEVQLNKQLAAAEAQIARLAGRTEKAFVDARATAQNAVDITNDRIAANQVVLDQIKEEKELLDEVLKAEGISTKDFIKNQEAETEAVKKAGKEQKAAFATNDGKGLESAAAALLKESEDAEKAREAAAAKRLEALKKVIKEVQLLEAQGIGDQTERLLALEELRFKAEQELLKTQFDELAALTKAQGEDLQEVTDLNDRKAEQQEEDHQANMAAIRKNGFAQEKAEQDAMFAEAEAEQDAMEAREGEISDKKVSAAIEANKEIEESNKELFNNISASAQKVGEVIGEIFKKQAGLSKDSVDEQVKNLERGQDRAAQGLKNNIVFEEQELARRQQEQLKRQKEAEQAQKIVALFSLVSAYAANGDQNALSRGLIDFAILEALSAGLGFEEGGYTGDFGTSDVAGVVHGKEFVVTAKDTAKYNLAGKSGDDFGEAMGDYYQAQSPVTQNPYKEQRESFKQGINTVNIGNSEMVKEIKAMRKEMSSQPNYSAQIVQVQKDVHEFVLYEQKKGMKKITKQLLRAMKK